jgi:chromosome partitioning protein
VDDWTDDSCLHIVASKLELARSLKNPKDKDDLFNSFVTSLRPDYDLILIDCPPTDSMLTDAAYLASNFLLVPVKPEFLSALGIPLLKRSLSDFKERKPNHQLEVAGILLNAVQHQKYENQLSREEVITTSAEQKWHVFQGEISYSDSYPRGAREGHPIFQTSYARAERKAELAIFAAEFSKRIGL